LIIRVIIVRRIEAQSRICNLRLVAFIEFRDNTAVAETDRGIAVLKTLMAQHGLGVADVPELGSKGNVSKILNGAEGKKLTRKHMKALSRRFGVSPALFF
jgi:HTH-type transcriptional regulator/antitoxin HigA